MGCDTIALMRFHFDRAGSFGWFFMVLLLALVGCDGGGANGEQDGGGLDGGRPDAARLDAGSDPIDGGEDEDGGHADDGGPADGGGSEPDGGGPTDDGGFVVPDACVPPPCAAPPEGCMYVGSDPCSCGTLVCPTDCNGVTCGSAEYCDFDTPFTCGGSGTCQPRPDFCSGVVMPVCGCDGATHSNACVAHSRGTDVAADGECGVAPTDCRTTGCPMRQTCQECRGVGGAVWVCLPRGAAC